MARQAGEAGTGTGMGTGTGTRTWAGQPQLLYSACSAKTPQTGSADTWQYISGYWAFGFVVWVFFSRPSFWFFFRLISFFLSTF